MFPGKGRTLTRTGSSGSSSSKRARKAATAPAKMSVGLRRYLDVRGTPRGTYEIVRTVTGYLDYGSNGWNIGAASYEAATWVFTPTSVTVYSSPSGNQATFSVPAAAEIAALWDKVKIDKVECNFLSSGHGASNSTVQQPLIVFAFDDNDSVTSADQIKQMDCKHWMPGDQNNPFKMTVRPCFQRIVYYTALVSSYEPSRGYVQSGTDIPHYALKMAMSPTGGIGRMDISFKFHFKCKELK